jgi:hypothetical protein
MHDPRTRRRPGLAAFVEALERRETPSQASFSVQAIQTLMAVRAARIQPPAVLFAQPASQAALPFQAAYFSRAATAARFATSPRAASLAAKHAPAAVMPPDPAPAAPGTAVVPAAPVVSVPVADVTPAGPTVAAPAAEDNAVSQPHFESSPVTAPLTKADSSLGALDTNYQQALKAGREAEFDGSSSGLILKGNTVLVDVRVSGDANALAGSLSAVDFQVKSIDSRFKIIEGFVPIAQLRALEGLPSVVNITGIQQPRYR